MHSAPERTPASQFLRCTIGEKFGCTWKQRHLSFLHTQHRHFNNIERSQHHTYGTKFTRYTSCSKGPCCGCGVKSSRAWYGSFPSDGVSSWHCCDRWKTKRSPQKQQVSRWVASFERQLTATQHLINRPWCESLRFESTTSTARSPPQPAPILHEPIRVQHKIIPLCQRLLCPKLTSSCQNYRSDRRFRCQVLSMLRLCI
jgi:hypothetical protein